MIKVPQLRTMPRCRSDTPTYKLQVKTRGMVCNCVLSHVSQLRTMPRCLGGLLCCYVPHGPGPRCPT
jgi:hypothetical protein